MRTCHIEVYHNLDSKFAAYADEHVLREVISTWRQFHDEVTPEEVAGWAFHVFNAELSVLAATRGNAGGEEDFLIAGVYRMLRLRSLSTGDVVAVGADGTTTWLACEYSGWRRINCPVKRTGEPLTAFTFQRLMWRGQDA